MHRNEQRVTQSEFDATQSELTDEFVATHPALMRYWLAQLVDALPGGIARLPDMSAASPYHRICFGFNRQHALTLLRVEWVNLP